MSNGVSIRVENLPGVNVSRYQDSLEPGDLYGSARPFRILFIKPYQPVPYAVHGPAMGILTLISVLREKFGAKADIRFRDMKLYDESADRIDSLLADFNPDVIALSALNVEAPASYEIAARAKRFNPAIITAIGGPLTLRQSERIFRDSKFDWIFEGAADRTFAAALARHFTDTALGDDLPGFNHRDADGRITRNSKQDLITDLDAIPIPAWDLHDFERSRRRDRRRIITNLDEHRYAYLFTSRGCPYLCNYCHDIFTKRFVYQSTERVMREIELLHERYGVTEFHFVDDIFNLHKPRAQEIMRAIAERWGKSLLIAFPNGLRGDILDQETIDAMVGAGTYNATISIETVTPRLQAMVEKHLDVDKAKWAIDEFARQGIIVHGAFMYGFPGETVEEMQATLDYAIRSPLMHAHFFSVVPQPGTPIYDQAMAISPQATETIAAMETEGGDYGAAMTWYQLTYGFRLRAMLVKGIFRFYFYPPRLWRYLQVYGVKAITAGFREFVGSQTRTLLAQVTRLSGRRSTATGTS